MGTEHDWITIHHARFAEPVDAVEQDFQVPANASCARLGLDTVQGDNGLLIAKSDIWGGWSICHSRSVAESIMSSPADHFRFRKNAVESWHALLVPYRHYGDVNWRGMIESGTAIRVGEDPGGPLAVITTAGFASYDIDQAPPVASFISNVLRVREFIQSLKGNIRAVIFFPRDDRDGITFTLWDSDASMVSAAYRQGLHRDFLLEHKTTPSFDRSSFTRARVIASAGTWDGTNPLEKAAS